MADNELGTKAPRRRSPSYPFISMKTAYEKTRLLYGKSGLRPIGLKDAIRTLGYSVNNSNGGRVLATMTSYGLLNSIGSGQGKQFQLTELAVRVVDGTRENSPEWREAIQQAARTSSMVNTFLNKYGRELNVSDEKLASELVREYRFSVPAASRFVQNLRETVAFVNGTGNGMAVTRSKALGNFGWRTQGEGSRNEMQDYASTREYALSVGDGRQFVLKVPKQITQEDYDLFVQWVKFLEKRLVAKPEDNGQGNEHHEVESQNEQA